MSAHPDCALGPISLNASQVMALFDELYERLSPHNGRLDRYALRPLSAQGQNAQELFRQATELAAFIGWQLAGDFSVEDMLGEAIMLMGVDAAGFDSQQLAAALHTVANLVEPNSVPVKPVGDGARARWEAATVAGAIAAGLILLAAEWWDSTPSLVICYLETQLLTAVRTAGEGGCGPRDSLPA